MSAFSPKKAKQEALESFRIPAGEANAGTMIDQRPSQPNPLYASDKGGIESTGSTLKETDWHSGFWRPGWRYIRDGALTKLDPLLKDEPRLPSVFEDGTPIRETSQVFETTALAIKGCRKARFTAQWNGAGKRMLRAKWRKFP